MPPFKFEINDQILLKISVLYKEKCLLKKYITEITTGLG